MKNIYFTPVNEWGQIGKDFNWYTFSPFSLSFEWDKSTGGVEVCLVILGFGGTLRYNYDWENSPVGKRAEEYFNENWVSDCCGGELKTISADEGTSHWECGTCEKACDRKFESIEELEKKIDDILK